jgi:hypothetical protein
MHRSRLTTGTTTDGLCSDWQCMRRSLVPAPPLQERSHSTHCLSAPLTHARQHAPHTRARPPQALKKALEDVPFVAAGRGGDVRVTPKSLLDPRNEVLAAIFEDEPDVFPQGPFARPEWLAVLADVGLRAKLDPGTFVQCATKVGVVRGVLWGRGGMLAPCAVLAPSAWDLATVVRLGCPR